MNDSAVISEEYLWVKGAVS